MRRILPGYFLLACFSFLFFTLIFHTAANAQSITINEEAPTMALQPSPTLFVRQITQSEKQIRKETSISMPTPTVYRAPVSPTPTSTIVPSKKVSTLTPLPTKTISPTLKPSITQIPLPSPTEMPSPTITPLPTTPVITDLETLFTKYSSDYSVDKELLKRIARCESGFNANANNAGMYLGMFQFGQQTWIANRSRMGLDTNPDLRTNAEESIRTAAFMISRGGQGAWPNCQ